MASRSGSSRPIGKILNAAHQPIYLIATDRIQYANSACLRWITPEHPGENPDDLSDPTLVNSLQPPSIVYNQRPLVVPVQPSDQAGNRFEPKDVLFVYVGGNPEVVLGVADCLGFSDIFPSVFDAIGLSEQLSETRIRYPKFGALPLLAGSSSYVNRLRKQSRVAMDCFSNVYLSGEQGSGGDQIAKMLHRPLADRDIPLIAIDCPLMDNELFEASVSPALAHIAQNDTGGAALLLRGCDQLPIETQELLLGILNDHPHLLRCYSVSQTSLTLAVEQGKLLQRLAFELSTIEIQIPGLLERIEDFPAIVHALIDRRSTPSHPIYGITRPAMDLLTVYPWPGGYLELDAAIRSAAASAGSSSIGPVNLPLSIRTFTPRDSMAAQQDQEIDLDRFLLRIERELIERALAQSDGNRAEAARKLGISRARLLRRLETDS